MSKKITGNKRIVHDCCVDLYNNVQKWISVTSDIHLIILNICMAKHKELSDEELYNEGLLEDHVSFDNVSPEMMNLSSVLTNKFVGLETVVEKMKRLTKRLRSILELSALEQSRSSNIDSDLDPILFQTWPLAKFCEATEEIEMMHRNELRIRSSITKELCIITNKSALTFFEAYWKYEPNIDRDRVNQLLEIIICELELQSQLS